MGSVWLAEHSVIGRRVAIKLLRAEVSHNPEAVGRFFNEARATTAISDPGIVQVFDFGTHSDGSAYLIMELLEGESLEQRLRRQRVLPVPAAIRIARQLASSLGAAHARGIVHRDIKPENVYLVSDAEVPGGERTKILDFGIAKLTLGGVLQTQEFTVMGTPAFMSPEQCRGAGHVDARSDVYSVGCVLFSLLAGRPPFWAEGAGEIIAMHLREQPPSLSRFVPDLPNAVDVLVSRCLAKDRDQRPASGRDLASSLEVLLASSEVLAAESSSLSNQSRDLAAMPWSGGTPLPSRYGAPRGTHAPSVATAERTTLSSSALAPSEQGAMSTRRRSRFSRKIVIWSAALSLAAALGGIVLLGNSPRDRGRPGLEVAPVEHDVRREPAGSDGGLDSIASNGTADPHVPSEFRVEVRSNEPRQIHQSPTAVIDSFSMLARAFATWASNAHATGCPKISSLQRRLKGELPLPTSELRIVCSGHLGGDQIGIEWIGEDGKYGTLDDLQSWNSLFEGKKFLRGKNLSRPSRASAESATDGTFVDRSGDGIPDD